MKKLIIIAMVLCLALTIVGCSKSTSQLLIGEWTAEMTEGNEKVNVGFTFQKDGTGTWGGAAQGANMTVTFKWTLNSDTSLTITPDMTGMPEMAVTIIEITKTTLTLDMDDEKITFTKK